MATLTVAGVEEALSKYKSVGSSFIAELNMVLPRLYAMGMWRDLLYEKVLQTSDGNFTLPEGESVVQAVLDDDPARVRARFHDYRLTGRNPDGNTLSMYGIVDDGFVPTINELNSEKVYAIHVEPIKPQTEIQRTSSNFLTVSGTDNNSTPEAIEFTTNFETASTGISSASSFTRVNEIKTGDSPLIHPVAIYAISNTGGTEEKLKLADVQPANTVSRFRRYRISNGPNPVVKTLRMLVKRQFKTLINSYDPVYPSNINAIKHGLLGTVAEDNADLERAQYHWSICKQLLDEELDAYRGAAKPTIYFDPSGSGTRTPNLM
jgi:hypothetical protein